MLGTGDEEAIDTLQRRTSQLANGFNDVKYGATQRESELEHLHDQVKDFEESANNLINLMDDTMEELSSDQLNDVNSDNISEIQDLLKVQVCDSVSVLFEID